MLNTLASEFFFNVLFVSSDWIYGAHCICLKTQEWKLKDVKFEFKCIVRVKCPKKGGTTGLWRWLACRWWWPVPATQAVYGKKSAVPTTLAPQAAGRGHCKVEGMWDHREQELWLNLGLPASNSARAFCRQKIIYHSWVGCGVKNVGFFS